MQSDEEPADTEVLEPLILETDQLADKALIGVERTVEDADLLSVEGIEALTLEDLDIIAPMVPFQVADHPVVVLNRAIDELARQVAFEGQPLETALDALFEDEMSAVADDRVEAMIKSINLAFDDRCSFEKSRKPDNLSIQKTLAKARKELLHPKVSRVLLAAGVEASFINRSERGGDGKRFNVYGIEKVANFARVIAGDAPFNKINEHILRSAFRLEAIGVRSLDLEMAKAACSRNYPYKGEHGNHLTRYLVSESTAPTQASSTTNACLRLGIMIETKSGRNPAFSLTNKPIVAHLRTMLRNAA